MKKTAITALQYALTADYHMKLRPSLKSEPLNPPTRIGNSNFVPESENHQPAHRNGAVPLCELRNGDSGTISAVSCSGGRKGCCGTKHERCHCDYCELLRAMGIGERARLRVCRSGRQCIVQVNSTRLGIAHTIARDILVSPDHAGS